MTHGVHAGRDQLSEMQLAGRLALSAAALLLLTLAYRYCKSRAARSGDDEGVDADRARPEEEPVFTGRKEVVFGGTGVRQRHIDNIKVTVANGGSADSPVDPGGPDVAEKSRFQGTPAKRRDKAERTKVSHLGVGDQPGTVGLVSAREEKGTSGGLLSYGNQAEVPAEEPNFQAFCSQEHGFWSPNSAREKIGCDDVVKDERMDQQTFRERHPGSENWSSIEAEKGDLLREEGPSPSFVQIQEIPKEKIELFQTTSDLGLVLKQTHMRTHSSFTFSSVAKVQIEENFIQEKESKEGSDGQTEPNLRSKVYNYDLQSKSVKTEKFSHSVVDTQLFHVLNQGSDGETEPNLRSKVYNYDLQSTSKSVETEKFSHSLVDTQLSHVLNQGSDGQTEPNLGSKVYNYDLQSTSKSVETEFSRSVVDTQPFHVLNQGSDGQTEPNLKSKVYNYDLQSTSKSVETEKFSHSIVDTQPSHVLNQESDGQTEPNLRSKVYNYDLQSTFKSVETEKFSHSLVDTQPFHVLNQPEMGTQPFHVLNQPEMDTQPFHVLNQPEKKLYPKPDQVHSDRGNDSRTFQMSTGISSGGDVPKPKSREGDAMTERSTKKHPLSRYTFTRNDSFRKIVDNPELQVPMKGFGSPAHGPSGKDTPPLVMARSSSTSSLVGSMQSLQGDTNEEPRVEQVAGAKFFHVPLGPESSLDVHLDLGNCHEVLCLAKKQKLEALKDAAYRVMADNYLQVLRAHGIYSRLNAAERDLILKRRLRGRKYVTVVDVSSQERGHPSSRLCFYDDREDTWHPLTWMPLEAVSKGCAVCSMFNYLFLVAGCEGRGRAQRPSNRVFCYNPLTNIWREICPLNQARPHCKLVALDGYLYAIGGECLYTVERYDPRTDRWTFVAPLPNDTFAVAHTATVCDGEIYVTGGTLRYTLLKYVARSDTWKVNLTSGSQDRTADMVTVNGFIYRFDLNRSAGIGVYRCGAKAKLWYECATYAMPFPAYFQCAVVENLVYCIGRQFHVRFLADYVSPRFGTKELQTFPSPQGSLLPVTLVLPDKEAGQTRV